MRKENKKYFHTRTEAEQEGYRPCAFCCRKITAKVPALVARYQQEKKGIHNFCAEYPFIKCELHGKQLQITNPVEHWLICYSQSKKQFLIYHENHRHIRQGEILQTPNFVPGYHLQRWTFISIVDTLYRILDHLKSYIKRPYVPNSVKYTVRNLLYPADRLSKRRKKMQRHAKRVQNQQKGNRVLALIHQLEREKRNQSPNPTPTYEDS